jgi:hypothetical protein
LVERLFGNFIILAGSLALLAWFLTTALLPFLKAGGSPAEFRAGIDRAITKGWLWRHESGVYVKFTPAGAELFA